MGLILQRFLYGFYLLRSCPHISINYAYLTTMYNSNLGSLNMADKSDVVIFKVVNVDLLASTL